LKSDAAREEAEKKGNVFGMLEMDTTFRTLVMLTQIADDTKEQRELAKQAAYYAERVVSRERGGGL